MTSTRISGEGPTLWDALQSAAAQLGVEGVHSLKWDYEREHFRGGAWSVRVSAEAAAAGQPVARQSTEGPTTDAHRWLRTLLGWFHNDGASISSRSRGEKLVLSIDGARDSKLFIGRDGKNLPAFQHLLDKAVTRGSDPDTRVLLDVDGYLGEREGRLESETQEAIEQVESTGEPVRLREMNSYERRLVHQMVKEHGGLVSRSADQARGGLKSVEIAPEPTGAE